MFGVWYYQVLMANLPCTMVGYCSLFDTISGTAVMLSQGILIPCEEKEVHNNAGNTITNTLSVQGSKMRLHDQVESSKFIVYVRQDGILFEFFFLSNVTACCDCTRTMNKQFCKWWLVYTIHTKQSITKLIFNVSPVVRHVFRVVGDRG